MFEKNNKSEGEDREQGEPESEGKQDTHGRKAGLIPNPRRKHVPGGMA
jgi:hypothetical protein